MALVARTETESRLALQIPAVQQAARKAGKDLVGAEGDGIVAAASQKDVALCTIMKTSRAPKH